MAFRNKGGAETKSRPNLRSPDDKMTLIEHLTELRVRLVRSVLAITIGAVVVFALYDQLQTFLVRPYRSVCAKHHWTCQLANIDPIGGFTIRAQVAIWGGVVIALPVLLWQIWRFVVPALHAKEKKYAIPFVVSSVLLFLFGGYIAWFSYPYALEFLIGYAGRETTPLFTVDKYIRLLILMIIAFGVGFLFPVLLVFLQLVRVLTPRALMGWWRQAIVLVLFIAAVITPSGDPISLFALAIPMTIFYFVSAGVGWLLLRRKPKPAKA